MTSQSQHVSVFGFKLICSSFQLIIWLPDESISGIVNEHFQPKTCVVFLYLSLKNSCYFKFDVERSELHLFNEYFLVNINSPTKLHRCSVIIQ